MGYAQNPDVVAEESKPPLGDPLKDANLKNHKSLAENPIALENAKDLMAPVFSFIDTIPADLVEQAAFKFRRARIRLTMKVRAADGTPFRILRDFEDSPELYWGQPIALNGYLTSLKPLPVEGDTAEKWRLGTLKLWNDDKSVRVLAQSLPEGLPQGEELNEPVSIVGYLFQAKGDGDSPEPLVVLRFLRRMQATIDPGSLTGVRDRRIGLPEEEADAYYRTLLNAKLISDAALKDQAKAFWANRQKQLKRPRPLFVDLFKSFEEDPNIYRGQAITLTGTLRKLRELTIDPENNFGIETMYEGWIFDLNSQSNPTVVVFTENSDDLPMGDEINVPVTVTGFVFKMYGYESRDKAHPLRVAPMLLAKSMTELHIADPTPFPIAWVAAAVALLCLGIVLYVWTSSRKDKHFRDIFQKPEDEEPPHFESIPTE